MTREEIQQIEADYAKTFSTSKADSLEQKRAEKLERLGSQKQFGSLEAGTHTVLDSGEIESNSNKIWNTLGAAEIQDMLSDAAHQQVFRRDDGSLYQIDHTGAEKEYTGDVRRAYMYGTKDDPNALKFGLARGDLVSSDFRYQPDEVAGYGWDPGESGVDINKKHMDMLLPYDVATALEGAVHGREEALAARKYKDVLSDEALKQGSGVSEYYTDFKGLFGDTSQLTQEELEAGDTDLLEQYRQLPGAQSTYQDMGDLYQQALSEERKAEKSSFFGRLGNMLDAVQAGAVKAGASTGDFLLDVITPGNNTWLDKYKDQEWIDEFVGYERSFSNEALDDALANFKKGDYLSAAGNVLAAPEIMAESLPIMLEMMLGFGKFTKAGKLIDAGTKGLTGAAKIAKAKEIKSILSIGDKAKHLLAANVGLLNYTNRTTSDQIEEFTANNDGVGPSALDVARMYGTTIALASLDRITFKEIIKTPKGFSSFKGLVDELPLKVQQNLGAKAVMAAGGIVKDASLEAGQEYLQTWGEILNVKWGTKDTPELMDVLTDEEARDEALKGMLGGFGAGAHMSGIGKTVSAAKDISIPSLLSKDVDITSEEGIETFLSTIKSTEDGVLAREDLDASIKNNTTIIDNSAAALEKLENISTIEELVELSNTDDAIEYIMESNPSNAQALAQLMEAGKVNPEVASGVKELFTNWLSSSIDHHTKENERNTIVITKLDEYMQKTDLAVKGAAYDIKSNIESTEETADVINDLDVIFKDSESTVEAAKEALKLVDNFDLETDEKAEAYLSTLKNALVESTSDAEVIKNIKSATSPKELNALLQKTSVTKFEGYQELAKPIKEVQESTTPTFKRKIVSALLRPLGRPTVKSDAVSTLTKRIEGLSPRALQALETSLEAAAIDIATSFTNKDGNIVVTSDEVKRIIRKEAKKRKAVKKQVEGRSIPDSILETDPVFTSIGEITAFIRDTIASKGKFLEGGSEADGKTTVTFDGKTIKSIAELVNVVKNKFIKDLSNAPISTLETLLGLDSKDKAILIHKLTAGFGFKTEEAEQKAIEDMDKAIKKFLDMKTADKKNVGVVKNRVLRAIEKGTVSSKTDMKNLKEDLEYLYKDAEAISEETYGILSKKLAKVSIASRKDIAAKEKEIQEKIRALKEAAINSNESTEAQAEVIEEMSDEEFAEHMSRFSFTESELGRLLREHLNEEGIELSEKDFEAVLKNLSKEDVQSLIEMKCY